MYREGLGLTLFGGFADHQGFDGNMLGLPGAAWHLELTHERAATEHTRPDAEALIVLYHPDPDDWTAACDRMLAAGFVRVTANNPYWETCAQTFEDRDGYRVVLAQQAWGGG